MSDMTNKNSEPNQTYPHARSVPVTSGVWAWVFWLRHWLAGYCRGRFTAGRKAAPMSARPINRRRRNSHAYFTRCALPPARDLAALRALLPRKLSPTQSQERLARISVLGRVRIYQIPSWGNVLLRRAQLTCYDHGWWRAPAYAAEPASLHPP